MARFCKRTDEIDGKRREAWDQTQLAIAFDVALRLGEGEPPERILVDLWAHGVRDHRGLLWAMPTTRDGSPPRTGFTKRLYRLTRQFHQMKREGVLPPPYDTLALLVPEYEIVREFSRKSPANNGEVKCTDSI